MKTLPLFEGFPRASVDFLRDLAKNNNTTWFQARRKEYEALLLDPARLFVADMGDRLRTVFPLISADPRVNRSLFRISRDTRFSKDKTPYKTHLGVLLWEGPDRMSSPGFYFELQADSVIVGAGMYRFTREHLDLYRERVIHRRHGAEVRGIVDTLVDRGFTFLEPRYKRVPRGFDPSHPNADLLRYDGLAVMKQETPPEETFSAGLVDWCMERWEDTADMHRWLVKTLS